VKDEAKKDNLVQPSVVALYVAIDDMRLTPDGETKVPDKFAQPLMSCVFNPSALSTVDSLSTMDLTSDQASALLPKFKAACAEMPMLMAQGMAKGFGADKTEEAKAGPKSTLVAGLVLPAGATLQKSGPYEGGQIELWDTPLSYDDAVDYVRDNWASLDSIKGLDRHYASDEQGINTHHRHPRPLPANDHRQRSVHVRGRHPLRPHPDHGLTQRPVYRGRRERMTAVSAAERGAWTMLGAHHEVVFSSRRCAMISVIERPGAGCRDVE
jgi:hypothetical protein